LGVVSGLRRLVVSFSPEGVEVRALYQCKNGPNPGTVARRREVEDLTRAGLREALAALEGPVDSIGTAGFENREDTLIARKAATTEAGA
jgi:hypothetical protein